MTDYDKKMAKFGVVVLLWIIVYVWAIVAYVPGWLAILNVLFLFAAFVLASREEIL